MAALSCWPAGWVSLRVAFCACQPMFRLLPGLEKEKGGRGGGGAA